jgi:putative transposase
MPWSQTSPLDQKTQFIADDLRARLAMTERCALYGVRRKTGSTGVDRYLPHGPPGLEERSRRPSKAPRHTPDHVVAARLAARQRHPSWGAKKLGSILSTRPPRWPGPARSTVCDLLSRNGFVPKTRKRRSLGHPGQPLSYLGAPNAVGRADVTGHCKPGDGRYGYPLTLTAGDSRFLLRCHALAATSVTAAKPVCTRVVKACGLPQRSRTDHGVPFATNTLGRLSPLSAWWVRLGSLPACSEPGTPQQNGRHERRHRPLKAETTRPPGATVRAHQRQFNHFHEEFTHERPHEALDRHTPAACDEPSPRKMPHTLPPLEYPDRFEVRDVSANGGLRWHHQGVNVSHVCVAAYVGLEEIDEGVGNIDCGPLTLGRFLERPRRIEDAYGRLTRRR